MSEATTTCICLVIIRRESGELFVHQRLANKRLFPELFGLGAGGRCEPGESPAAAARRELQEETGLAAAPTRLFEVDYRSAELHHRISVFDLMTSLEPAHDAREWQWSGWLEQTRVRELAEQGLLCPDTALVFERFSALAGESGHGRHSPDQ